MKGWLAFILHAHLPFVRHPEQHDFLEERWFFEAVTESYLPLLERFQRLANDGVPFRLAMSFSPTLLTMLADPLLQDRYVRHLERLIELAGKEVQRTRWQPPFQRLALFYHHRLTRVHELFVEGYRRDLIRACRELSDRGYLEPLASCATHGFLPLLGGSLGPSSRAGRTAIRAQVHVGMQMFEQAFGRRPSGFWLPECGYTPGIDTILKAYGIRYFITDAHGVLFGSPRPRYGHVAPAICPSGVAAFGRDLSTFKSVWSDAGGYPTHADYRDFYRDIGYDLEYDYLRAYLSGDGTRISTGIKYYRVTGRSDEKQPYDPDRALEQAAQHAEHFLQERRQQVQSLRKMIDRTPILVSPYDAELFGHWWFEGPDWLEFVIRKAAAGRGALPCISPSDYLAAYPEHQVLEPAMSSWGLGGYHEVWLNGSNDWIYRHLHMMAERMVQAARRYPRTNPLRRRTLNQMARELLLAQSSDWAFILKAQTHTAYAYRRLNDHVARFTHLYDALMGDTIDETSLSDIEARDDLFPFLDYRIYATAPRSA